jgi:hypothetical protein
LYYMRIVVLHSLLPFPRRFRPPGEIEYRIGKMVQASG